MGEVEWDGLGWDGSKQVGMMLFLSLFPFSLGIHDVERKDGGNDKGWIWTFFQSRL